MISALMNHLWQSTVFAALATILVLALRNHRANVRHAVWLAASIKFLLPFSLLVALGSLAPEPKYPLHAPAPAPPATLIDVVQFAQPFAAPAKSIVPEVAAGIWFCGFITVVAIWFRRSMRMRAALRVAVPVSAISGVRVRSTPLLFEPGVFGIFQPVLLLPEGISDRLTPEQMRAVIAHELCHVRRRDNLAALLHMSVEAIFWFHPLVWWIGVRLVEERERACDEAVVESGAEPEEYAAGILNVCKFCLESPLACVSGITGANLKRRIAAIMAERIALQLTLARKSLLAAVAVAVIGAPLAIGLLHAQNPPLRFEVATIKPVKADGLKIGFQLLPGGELRLTGTTVRDLIVLGYGVRPDEVSGGPKWIYSDGYEVIAKPERVDGEPAVQAAVPGSPAWRRMQQRIQALLADRFQLGFHKESKAGQVYAMSIAKGGFKLKESEQAGQVPPSTMRSPGKITGRAGSITMLTTVLGNWLGRPVEDHTGLTGQYDYVLEYAQDTDPTRSAPAEASTPAASLFTALQEQMGLKLESTRGTVETIVIDRAEKPAQN
jgi:uncharacterized protein (TIGR03435 family)